MICSLSRSSGGGGDVAVGAASGGEKRDANRLCGSEIECDGGRGTAKTLVMSSSFPSIFRIALAPPNPVVAGSVILEVREKMWGGV